MQFYLRSNGPHLYCVDIEHRGARQETQRLRTARRTAHAVKVLQLAASRGQLRINRQVAIADEDGIGLHEVGEGAAGRDGRALGGLGGGAGMVR